MRLITEMEMTVTIRLTHSWWTSIRLFAGTWPLSIRYEGFLLLNLLDLKP
jgi:hypothetical protein